MVALHRLAVLLCAFAFALLLLGALVTSTGSGLAISAWPGLGSTQGIPGASLQLAHRILAAIVGILALAVVSWAWRYDSRPWMKGLSVAAAALLLAQAIYGGIAVLTLLPAYFSVFHAAFAQLFFALTVAMALFTSPAWSQSRGAARPDRRLTRLALASTLAIYAQVILGAAMRHSYAVDGRPAGLAIPDYPLAFGKVLPLQELASGAVVLGFSHRLMALATASLVTATVIHVYRRHETDGALIRPASLLALLIIGQIVLGGLTVLSGMTPLISASHAAAVAVTLGAALVLLLRASQPALAFDAAEPVPAGTRA
jgi:cytochrome c oxidase assembly protein subunit 15